MLELRTIRAKFRDAFHSGFCRKPVDWTEVGYNVPRRLIEQLVRYTSEEFGIAFNIGATFRDTPKDTVFTVEHEGGLYLVDTQGSNYARYIRFVGSAEVYPK